jgi:uncharacterized protein YcfJ
MLHSSKPLCAAIVAGGVAALAALPAGAYETWAPVTSKRPIYAEGSEPSQQCWTERVIDHDTMRLDEAPIGVRGKVVEGPGGKDLVVVPHEREVQRCRTVDTPTSQLQGYEVHYVYDGHEYVTRLSYDPGSQVRVNVDINTAQPY